MHRIFLLLVAVVAFASGQQSCDATCQAAFNTAFAQESALWVSKDVSVDPFYDVPVNVSGAEPGALLRWEHINADQLSRNWSIPAGMSLSRFLYMSEDINGSSLLASAFALLPVESNANGRWNTVVWAHGTAGRARNCAPTNHKALYYNDTIFSLVNAGYAVIGPDYAGLGTHIPQEFMYESGFLHVADVAYSLIAARKSIGSLLSDSWITIGHSEGGMTAWRTNERLAMPNQSALLEAGKFLGAVSMAPALRPLGLIPESFRRANGGPVGDVVSAYLLQSLSRLFTTQIREDDYLTDLSLDRLTLADRACVETGFALFSNLTQTEMYKNTSWITHPAVVDWQKRYNGVGPYRLAAPMLVIQGVTDPLTYAPATEKDFNLTCATFPESSAELLLYPGQDHDGVLVPGQGDYLRWIADRFNGVQVRQGCVTRTVSSS